MAGGEEIQKKWTFYGSLPRRPLLCGVAVHGDALTQYAQQPSDPLKAGFLQPPASARPRVWWHWMNGNITKEGIKLDVEWMHRVGPGRLPEF